MDIKAVQEMKVEYEAFKREWGDCSVSMEKINRVIDLLTAYEQLKQSAAHAQLISAEWNQVQELLKDVPGDLVPQKVEHLKRAMAKIAFALNLHPEMGEHYCSEKSILARIKSWDGDREAAWKELRELREIVAKLPKTGDGVAIYPGMTVYVPDTSAGKVDERTIGLVGSRASKYIEEQQEFGAIGVKNSYAWSTKAAAEEAMKGGGK